MIQTLYGITRIGTIGADAQDPAIAGADFVQYYALSADDITSTIGTGWIVAGSGNDTIQASNGSPSLESLAIWGDEGADSLQGGAGDDRIYGGSDFDSLFGGDGNDVLVGGGPDLLLQFSPTSGFWSTRLFQSDQISGGDGNDLIVGNGTLEGGAGQDFFALPIAQYGSALIEDFTAGDILLLGPSLRALSGDWGPDAYLTLTQDGADTLVNFSMDATGLVPVVRLVGADASSVDPVQIAAMVPNQITPVTNLWASLASAFADTVNIMYTPFLLPVPQRTLYTLGGNDVVVSEIPGNYSLGFGDDRYTATPSTSPDFGAVVSMFGASHIYGGWGNDTLAGSNWDEVLEGGAGNDSLVGGAGNDQLYGDGGSLWLSALTDDLEGDAFPGAWADTLSGGDGSDLLLGAGGQDLMDGGAGSDLFVWEIHAEFGDTITGFQASDRLFFNGLIDPSRGTNWTQYVSLVASGADTLLYLDRDASGPFRADLVATLQGVSIGSLTADQLPGLSPGLHALEPLDVVVASEWNDSVVIDSLSPQTTTGYYLLGGNDTVSGSVLAFYALGNGNDTFNASPYLPPDASVNGGAGNDVINGGHWRALLIGGTGRDSITGGDGDDTLIGDGLDDRLILNSGDPTLSLAPQPLGATDTLIGGAGNDLIEGGDGADQIWGGTGRDTFVIEGLESLGDVIHDFTTGAQGDVLLINLVHLYVNGAVIGDYVKLLQTGADTEVLIDPDADGVDWTPQRAALLTGVQASSIALGTQVLLGDEWRPDMRPEPYRYDHQYSMPEDGVFDSSLVADGALTFYGQATTWLDLAPTNGTASIAPTGTFVYVPNANFYGTDYISFRVTDPDGATGTALVRMNVVNVQDAPTGSVLISGSPAVGQTMTVSNTVQDGDGMGVVTYHWQLSADGGANWGNFGAPTGASMTPNLNQAGMVARVVMSYTDGAGKLETVISGVTAAIAATSNAAPVASPATLAATEDTTLNGNLPAAVDGDGDPITYSLAGAASHGSAQVNANGTFSYVPVANYAGQDSFQFRVADNKGAQNTYTATVTVSPVNDAPTASSASITATEDTLFQGTLPAYTDVDGDAATYSLAAQAAHGAAAVNPGGTFTYTGASNFNGADSFQYTISDGKGGTNTYAVSVTVNASNDAPIVANAIPDRNAVQGEAFQYQVASNAFTDVDAGDSLTYSATLVAGGALPAWLSFSAATRTFSGTPAASDLGTVSVRVTATDLAHASVSDDFALTVAQVSGQTIVGTPADDSLAGGAGADTISGLAGDDVLRGQAGNDLIDGGAGLDAAMYSSNRAQNTAARLAGGDIRITGQEGTDTLHAVERAVFADLALGFDVDGTGGEAYRIYKAAFDRLPDAGGLGFWMYYLDRGFDFNTAADAFLNSAEFIAMYGPNPTNQQFVGLLYQHVLQRLPDQAGYDFWNAAMTNQGGAYGHPWSRGEVLVLFSESAENKANVIGQIENGFEYLPFAP